MILFKYIVFAIVRTSLVLMFIYCTHKSVVSRLFVLRILHCKEPKLFSLLCVFCTRSTLSTLKLCQLKITEHSTIYVCHVLTSYDNCFRKCCKASIWVRG
jgi:hypothetical protein